MGNINQRTRSIAPIFISEVAKRDYINETDDALFKKMANRNSDSATANNAWREMMIRFGGYVWKVCAFYFRKEPDTAIDIARATFYKVYMRAGTFKNGTSVKAWLGTIAKNECIDLYNERKLHPAIDLVLTSKELPPISRTYVETKGFSRLPLESRTFWEVWNAMDEHKREVLKAYLRHYEVDDMGDNKHLPEHEVEYLCKSFPKIIKNSYYISKIRNRAWSELEKKCKFNYPFKN